jgi:hypothetical protein
MSHARLEGGGGRPDRIPVFVAQAKQGHRMVNAPNLWLLRVCRVAGFCRHRDLRNR